MIPELPSTPAILSLCDNALIPPSTPPARPGPRHTAMPPRERHGPLTNELWGRLTERITERIPEPRLLTGLQQISGSVSGSSTSVHSFVRKADTLLPPGPAPAAAAAPGPSMAAGLRDREENGGRLNGAGGAGRSAERGGRRGPAWPPPSWAASGTNPPRRDALRMRDTAPNPALSARRMRISRTGGLGIRRACAAWRSSR